MVLCTVEFDGKVRTCFEALTDLLVREQFLSVCSIEMALFKREKVPQNTEVMTTLADNYIEAHGGCITGRSVKKKDVSEIKVGQFAAQNWPISACKAPTWWKQEGMLLL